MCVRLDHLDIAISMTYIKSKNKTNISALSDAAKFGSNHQALVRISNNNRFKRHLLKKMSLDIRIKEWQDFPNDLNVLFWREKSIINIEMR